MEPLLGDMPLVGALSVFFLKKPVSADADNTTLVNLLKLFRRAAVGDLMTLPSQ